MTQLKLVAELVGHESRVWQISWDPAGTRLASCSSDRSARIWAPISPERFFSGNMADSAMELDANQSPKTSESWQCLETIDNAHKRTVRSVVFEPTRGESLATASFDGTTAIWSREPGEEAHECIATLEGHENEVKSVAWSPSGQLLATCGRDKSVWIWESNGEGDFDCISVLMEHTQDVKMVLWHPKDDLLVSFSYDDTIRVWKEDDDDWYSAATLTGHESTVWAGAFNADGKYLASVSDDRTMRVWTRRNTNTAEESEANAGFYYRPDFSFECVAKVPDSIHKRAIYSVSWCGPTNSSAEDGDLGWLATGCSDNILRVFKATETGAGSSVDVSLKCAQENAHGLSDINCVQWNPVHPGWLATCGDDGIVRIWHLEP
ncbi:Cytosolic iron-sulfur protein assembly protein [Coemansia sp. RSA 989]|nr:WD40-repeat-containing domain protein [Coemansia mojavensis]KAJ1861700.1 Cytosolic iron-sulfur protein assembly protein [Coemansia sp. RSA 989]KAJ1868773.1 Cytosolic iron-sulfur protein assembly protein [Coemansia sp. RSA 990]KAJ2628457.1 Cytosolic iron-sulfur protein assembly protein [Coemansia sp. RSA 1290]KAJ2668116.1 Cytosolic iron-sulfur protein assembly protein [Coemansia sp. RSA 1085]